MWILLAGLLALALLVTLRRLAGHRRSFSRLQEAISRAQPFLREQVPGAAGHEWDALCESVNRQITALRALQQQQSGQLTQLEATLGSLQEAVLVVDAHNYIVLANRALQAIFPRTTRILDQRLEVVLHSVAFLNYVEAVRRQEARPREEIEFVDTDATRWVEVTGTTIPPLNDQKGSWALFVLHDVTRQKLLEQMRREFVANVSHELRTPLSVIKGYLETLIDDHDTLPPADRRRFLLTAQRHADRLHALLEDLLTLSRLESSHSGFQCEPTDLHHLLGAVAADYGSRSTAARHHLKLEVAPDLPAVPLDPLKLTQACENLIDNALKYTPPGSTIRLLVERRDQEVLLQIRDNGPGIPAADLPHIFERFYRVEKGRSREKGGTGLGLSIVKHIVQLHGGRVWVESVLGQGTTFFLTLPLEGARPSVSPVAA